MSPIALLIVCLMTVAPVLSKTYLVETKDEIHKGPETNSRDYADTGDSVAKKTSKEKAKSSSDVTKGPKKMTPSLDPDKPGKKAQAAGQSSDSGKKKKEAKAAKDLNPDETMDLISKLSTVKPIGPLRCRSWEVNCNGKCQHTEILCEGKCGPSLPKGYHVCGDSCYSPNSACEGKCSLAWLKRCDTQCFDPDHPMNECDGECRPARNPCHGKCSRPMPVKCGKTACLRKEEEKLSHVCDGKCLWVSQQCKGKCPPSRPKKCGTTMCLKEKDKKYHEVEGKCVPSYVRCGGKCMDHLPRVCRGKCHYSDNYGRYDNRVIGCNGTAVNLKKDECQEVCVNEKTYQEDFQDCDGKCILKHDYCESNCAKGLPCYLGRPEPIPFVDKK